MKRLYHPIKSPTAAAPSGFSLQCPAAPAPALVSHPPFRGVRGGVPHKPPSISAAIPNARPSEPSPRFAANHPIPSLVAFPRAANPAHEPSHISASAGGNERTYSIRSYTSPIHRLIASSPHRLIATKKGAPPDTPKVSNLKSHIVYRLPLR